jgi:Fe(3+) dicitrate transport protein
MSLLALLALVTAVAAAPAAAEEPDAPPVTADGAAAEREADEADLDRITIVGDQGKMARIGGSAYVVSEAALDEHEYDDVHRVLQEVPGVYVREEDGQGLRPNIGIRGASSERSAKVTLMEDGILFGPAPYAAPAAYYFPLVTRMVAVEVFKGPASIQYGPQTIGGAINLVTRPIPEGAAAAADIAVGSYGSTKVHGWAGGRYRGFGLLLEGVNLATDGFKELDNGDETGFTRNEAMLKADYRWPSVTAADLITELKLGYSDEVSNETYLGLTDADFDANPVRRYVSSELDRMDWDRWQVQLQQIARLDNGVELRLTGYRHELTRSWRKLNRFAAGAPSLNDIFASPTGANAVYVSVLRGDEDSASPREALLVGTNARDFVSQGLQLVGTWDPVTGPVTHALEAGIRLHYDEIVRDHTEDSYLMVDRSLERTAVPTNQLADNEGDALAVALHLRDEMQWRRLTVTPGLRFESIATDFRERVGVPAGDDADTISDTQNVVIPGIGAVYFLTEELSVLGGVHRGFSPVAPGQSGNADPEEAINYEAGGRWFSDFGNLQLIGFFNDYDNLVATCRQGTGCDPEEIDDQFDGGDVNVWGLELFGETEPEIGWGVTLPSSLAYTFTQSEFRSSFTSASSIFGEVEKGDELPYLPEHQVNVSLGLERYPWGLATSMTYVGEMRDVAGQGAIPEAERIEDHFVVDMTVYREIFGNGRVYLTFENLADAEYMVSRRPYGARPGMPLQVWGGVRFNLGS